MFVFGYGSLMWDGWEEDFGGKNLGLGTLRGHRRSFNKASVRNWGSSSRPCSTLGLREDPNELCVGSVFEIPENHTQAALSQLEQREGSSFSLQEHELELQNGKRIGALVAVNDVEAPTYIGNLTLKERARIAQTAAGCHGRCIDYIANIATELRSLGVQDPHVETFLTAVRDLERLNSTDP